MYKRHKVSIAVCMALTIAGTFFLGIDYASIAEIAITVVAITLAVYTSVASVLIGNPYAHKMKKVRDSEVKTKTSLGVIASYLRGAGLCSTATIVISTIYLNESRFSNDFIEKRDLSYLKSLAMWDFSLSGVSPKFCVNL